MLLASPRFYRGAFLILMTTLTAVLFARVALRFRLQPDVSSLLPDRGDAASLREYVRAFGGGDLAVVLVKGDDADEVSAVSGEVATTLRAKPTVRSATDHVDQSRQTYDATLAWLFASERARSRLANILTPEGMRARLRETRALLLAPALGSAKSLIAA